MYVHFLMKEGCIMEFYPSEIDFISLFECIPVKKELAAQTGSLFIELWTSIPVMNVFNEQTGQFSSIREETLDLFIQDIGMAYIFFIVGVLCYEKV